MTLTPKQIQAITLLASGMTGREVASKIGVCPQTLSVWRQSPDFRAELHRIQTEALEEARERIRLLAPQAVETLEKVMCLAPSLELRRKAALDILTMGELVGDKTSACPICLSTPQKVEHEALVASLKSEPAQDSDP